MDLALDNLQGLICRKIQPNNQPTALSLRALLWCNIAYTCKCERVYMRIYVNRHIVYVCTCLWLLAYLYRCVDICNLYVCICVSLLAYLYRCVSIGNLYVCICLWLLTYIYRCVGKCNVYLCMYGLAWLLCFNGSSNFVEYVIQSHSCRRTV